MVAVDVDDGGESLIRLLAEVLAHRRLHVSISGVDQNHAVIGLGRQGIALAREDPQAIADHGTCQGPLQDGLLG